MHFVRRRIAELCKKQRVRESHLSEFLGRNKTYIYNITSGRNALPLTELLKICEFFSISVKDFFDEELVEPPQRYETIEGVRALSEEDYSLVRDLVKRLNGSKR